MKETYMRRVGAARPSHLMFTSGVGSLVDLPNFSVLVRGLDDWRYDTIPNWEKITEPRLVAGIKTMPGLKKVDELRPAPWMPGMDSDAGGPASRVGVPVTPFPSWMRCAVCNELAPLSSGQFRVENNNPHRPHDAKFVHKDCTKSRKGPLAVPARFVLACVNGHLDEFPYVRFVHEGGNCPDGVENPRLRMDDRGANIGANVEIRCDNCGARRNIRQAMGARGLMNLPACRGRHPHLAAFDPKCGEQIRVLIIGASNQWFPQTLSALAVPELPGDELGSIIEKHWDALEQLPPTMYAWARKQLPVFRQLERWTDAEVAEVVERRRHKLETESEPSDKEPRYPDLRTSEWNFFTRAEGSIVTEDFALRRADGYNEAITALFSDVVQVERLREVRALVGFTRLDAPDPDDPELVAMAPLSRGEPDWVPGSEVRGEGIFLRVREDILAGWEERVMQSRELALHKLAYAHFRRNRYSDRLSGDFNPMQHWPGARYIALHSLSHMLIRTISLDCGYSSASLSERIYAGTPEELRGGILIYTAVPDAEGTLGGLVSQAEPGRLERLVSRALNDALRCSSDPLCAERLPHPPADYLHGAACHVCLFLSETTCERGNRFLDRRFAVPIDDPALALLPQIS